MAKLLWKKTVEPGRSFHLAGCIIKKLGGVDRHSHDFPELFWIKSGVGFHCINTEIIPLSTGNVVFLRPSDSHTFKVDKDQQMELINLAFPIERISFYKNNYFSTNQKFPWLPSKDILPLMILLNAKQNVRISKELKDLSRSDYSILALDAFLLNLFSRFIKENKMSFSDSEIGPEWLSNAIEKIKSSSHIHKSNSDFMKMCHKSPEHVNRTVKKIYQLTTTDLVNKIKMDFAKSKLQLSNDSIVDIALSCGFNNLGNFYKIFKKSFGETPNSCRKKARSIL